MFQKLAFSQSVIRAMAGEKQAGIGYKAPLIAGAGLAAGVHVLSKGVKKGKEYHAGFAPGVIENGGH